jgi:hypothetical protein
MRCLDCMNATTDMADTTDPSFRAKPVIALCAWCGAAVCCYHARTTRVEPPRIGLVPQTTPGVRRILCTPCSGTAATASTARPRVAAASP